MSIKRILYALALMAIVHATVAGAADDKPNGTITLIDLAGRTVSVHVPVERVVLTFYFEEYVPVEGGDDPFKRIVGWNRGYWEGRRPKIWETFKSAFPEINDIPDVGYINKGTFNAEKVISPPALESMPTGTIILLQSVSGSACWAKFTLLSFSTRVV